MNTLTYMERIASRGLKRQRARLMRAIKKENYEQKNCKNETNPTLSELNPIAFLLIGFNYDTDEDTF